jgi:Predicted dehydrogenases and related proteins
MKLGIIGTGMIVKNFLPMLQKVEGLTTVAILSTERSLATGKALAAQYGIPIYTSNPITFYSSGIDTVYVAVPNFLHFEIAMAAIDHCMNIIIEKPIVCNEKELYLLKEKAIEKHVFLFEAITTLHLGNYTKIKEWLPRIGQIKIVQSRYSQYSSRYDAFRAGIVLPAFDSAKAGGSLMDLNIYNLHFVMGLFGSPEEFKYYANVEKDIDTSGILILKYDKFSAACTAAKDCRGERGSIVQGTDGTITTSTSANLIGPIVLELNNGIKEEYDDGMSEQRAIPEFDDFIKIITDDNYLKCMELLNQSNEVIKLMTKARKDIGVLFPTDQNEA